MNRAEATDRIGVFDSGVGGLSVWKEIVRQLPDVPICYLADQAHVPYGSRSLSEVHALSEAITHFLLKQGAGVIVIACNTASAAALHHLRRLFSNVPFVGMEPAVKPAAERTHNGVIGVIATQVTFQGDLFASLVERYAGDTHVLTRACPALVEAVEAGALDTPTTEEAVRQCIAPLVAAGIDQLVLGCTHYPFLRPVIERLAGPQVTVIDPAPAVALQTARVWRSRQRQEQAPPLTLSRPRHTFYTTGDVPAFAALLGRLLPDQDIPLDCVHAAHWQAGRLEPAGRMPR